MDYARSLRNLFAALTVIIIGFISLVKIGTVDLHAIVSTGITLTPAVVIMGIIGQKIGEILDNPRNRADADYKLAVLNALKKMDKSITLQELNEKLTKTVAEPDSPDTEAGDDLDV